MGRGCSTRNRWRLMLLPTPLVRGYDGVLSFCRHAYDVRKAANLFDLSKTVPNTSIEAFLFTLSYPSRWAKFVYRSRVPNPFIHSLLSKLCLVELSNKSRRVSPPETLQKASIWCEAVFISFLTPRKSVHANVSNQPLKPDVSYCCNCTRIASWIQEIKAQDLRRLLAGSYIRYLKGREGSWCPRYSKLRGLSISPDMLLLHGVGVVRKIHSLKPAATTHEVWIKVGFADLQEIQKRFGDHLQHCLTSELSHLLTQRFSDSLAGL